MKAAVGFMQTENFKKKKILIICLIACLLVYLIVFCLFICLLFEIVNFPLIALSLSFIHE